MVVSIGAVNIGYGAVENVDENVGFDTDSSHCRFRLDSNNSGSYRLVQRNCSCSHRRRMSHRLYSRFDNGSLAHYDYRETYDCPLCQMR